MRKENPQNCDFGRVNRAFNYSIIIFQLNGMEMETSVPEMYLDIFLFSRVYRLSMSYLFLSCWKQGNGSSANKGEISSISGLYPITHHYKAFL